MESNIVKMAEDMKCQAWDKVKRREEQVMEDVEKLMEEHERLKEENAELLETNRNASSENIKRTKDYFKLSSELEGFKETGMVIAQMYYLKCAECVQLEKKYESLKEQYDSLFESEYGGA